MTKILRLPRCRARVGRLFLSFSIAMLAATLSAEQYDRLLEAIHIPKGAYFDTGCVITDTPRVVARVSVDATSTFDLFGVKARSAGCWILNLESGKFYYRYGTQAHGGAKNSYTAGQYLEIDCGEELIVNGTSLQTCSAYDFSANATAMTIPGTSYLGAFTLMSFKIYDGGETVRDFVPAEKNGEYGLYDRIHDVFYANVGTGTVIAGEPTDPALLRFSWLGGSGSFSDATKWEDGRKPIYSNSVVTIFGTGEPTVVNNDMDDLRIKTLIITNTAATAAGRGPVTLTGKSITLSGNNTTALATYTTFGITTNDAPLRFTGSSASIMTLSNPFNCLKPVIVDKFLYFRSSGDANSKYLRFYDEIAATNATLSTWSSMGVYLYAPVTAATIISGYKDGNGYYYFNAGGGSCTNVLVYHFGDVKAETMANAYPTNMVMGWFWDYKNSTDTAGYSFSHDQTVDRIVCPEPLKTDGVTVVERASVKFSSGATLTLKGSDDALAYAKLQGTGNLVWDPVGDYTQEFKNRNHTLAGTLTVKRGTLKFSGTSTIGNVTALVVDGGRFEIESAVGLPATLASVEVRNGGVISLPDGLSVTATRVLVNGVYVAPDEYSGATEGWLDGTGSITAVNDGVTCWKSATSGNWSDASNWTAGVPGAGVDTWITAAGGDYTVSVGDGAVMPRNIHVANEGAGTATVSINGAVAVTNAYITLATGGMIDVPTGGSFTYRGIDGNGTRTVSAPAKTSPVSVSGGRFRVSGGTAFFDNYAGMLTINGDGDCTGRVEVTSGTFTYLPNHEYDFFVLGKGGEAAVSGGSIVLDYCQTQDRSTLSQRGGNIVVTGGKFLRAAKGSHTYYQGLTYGTGTTTVHNGGTVSQLYSITPSDNSAAVVTLMPGANASSEGQSVNSFLIGGASGSRTEFNVSTTNISQLGYNVYVTGGYGEEAVVNVSNGRFRSGARNMDIGSCGTWRHTFTGISRGVLNVYDGGSVFCNGEASYQTGWGTMRLYGIHVGFCGYSTFTDGVHVDGELNAYGGVVTNRYGDFSIGCGYATGRMLVDGGTVSINRYHDRQSAADRAFVVGLAGGNGACVVSDGLLEVNCHAYIGGVETNAFFTGYDFANNGYPADRHDAVGSLEFAGGNAQFNNGLVLGADGVGTFTRVGAAGSVTASELVLSNTVENAESGATLRFVFDAEDGIAPLVVAGRTAIRGNAKLEIDLGSWQPSRRMALLRTAGFDGVDFASVSLTGDHAADAVFTKTGNGLFVGSSIGTLILVK